MSDYSGDRRIFAAMRQAGWSHDAASGGFTKRVQQGAVRRRLWVSWGQAEGALRLADAGEKAAGVVGQSETLAKIIVPAGHA